MAPRHLPILAALGIAAGILPGCRRLEADPPRALFHRLTRPANPDGVFLNEELVFHFSGEIDRSSVTRESVSIATADGRPARGTLHVEGARVRFVPAPVLARDLADGGYLPGTEYLVEIAGFPRPDGLRGLQGEPLRAPYRWSFRTVRVGAERDTLVFEARDPDRIRPLRFVPGPTPSVAGGGEPRLELGTQDALFLKCDAPLDPSTLVDGAFSLVEFRRRERVPLQARLLENEAEARIRPRPAHARSGSSPEAWEREPRAALIELLPERRLEPGDWHLSLGGPPIELSPRDLAGHVVWDPSLARVAIQIAERGRDTGRGSLHEAFLDVRLRSTVAVPGADGTAHWSDSGRVEVRLPRAAGDGSAGEVTLGADESRTDVQAVRLVLPEGVECRLPGAPGPVVLRAQGSLRIQGSLLRDSGLLVPMRFSRSSLSQWLDGALSLPAERAAQEANWTVVVAGGDLWIDGTVDVSTPLLLCAGGRIRVSGSVRAGRADQVFRLGEGGGEGLVASNVEDLEIDAPVENPLRAALRFAVLSGPIPPRGEVMEWLEADPRGSGDGRASAHGTWSVRYVPELRGAPAAYADLHAVDHPRLLAAPGPLQFLVELTVEPAPGRWRPPFVDFVDLAWRETAPDAAREPR